VGAAYLAGLAVGYWKSVDDLQQQWSIDRNLLGNAKKEVDKLLKTGTKLGRAGNWVEE
jgi:glycerol kinase